MTVRTRYAPSPTGEPHLGNIRTALYDWLLARHYGGQFILRIEDTDQQRYTEGGVEALEAALRWLGLEWDEGPAKGGPFGPYVQSQRLDIYHQHSDWLIEHDHAYRCYCSPERLEEVRKAQQARKEPPRYDRHCRDLTPQQRAEQEAGGARPVVRFKTPLGGETVTHDVLRGIVVFQNSTLDDFVILKSDGYPTYHLAAMVDDHLMEITHVIRGDEWLPSAPRHFLIYQAFGWEPPLFAHVSRILGPDKAKLSKRHGADSVLEYRLKGYLPDAVVNFLALLGWSLDDHTEIIDRETLIKSFDVDRLIPNPAIFNAEKLLWMNGVYIRELSPDAFAEAVKPYLEEALSQRIDDALLHRIVPLVQERVRLLSEIVEIADFFFTDEPLAYDTGTLLGKKFAGRPGEAAAALLQVVAAAEGTAEWTHDSLEAAIRPLAEGLGVKAGDLFGVVRVAVTGKTATPPLFETMEVLGRDVTLERLRAALARLS
ncbi:MAG TPA: glutamate--tRNA ligase [Dehalococcoidia bacterium]|jgi:glutamyl-tRNA synthetase|nr:glutamate--tRNA ligase [Dehalococcoidia bacterium]